jgi:hypothetical protein
MLSLTITGSGIAGLDDRLALCSSSDVGYWHETDVSTGSEMSAYRGTPEVIGARQNDAIDPKETCR